MLKRSFLAIGVLGVAACSHRTPFEPLTALPFAVATPSCGPTDAPIVSVYLASQQFELSQPVAPFIQIHLPRASSALKAGDVFQVSEPFTHANAWFHGSGVETMAATGGEVGITAFTASALSGYIDLEFPGDRTFRGTFSAVWQQRQLLCG